MFTEDIQILESDKDVSKSCIFDFPDRPPDTLPPQYPPVDPPPCYPSCPPDDWPPPVPPTPPPLPPGVIPHGFTFSTGLTSTNFGHIISDPNFPFDEFPIVGFYKTQIFNNNGNLLGELIDTNFLAGSVLIDFLTGSWNSGDHPVAIIQGNRTGPAPGFQKSGFVITSNLFYKFPAIPFFIIKHRISITPPPNEYGSFIAIMQIAFPSPHLPVIYQTSGAVEIYDLDATIYFYQNGFCASICFLNGVQIFPS